MLCVSVCWCCGWAALVRGVIMSKFFSLVSATWWQDLTNVEAQLHKEVLQLCLEIFRPRQCQHPGIRPKEGCITQEREHLCFWRAIHKIPNGLGGEMRSSTSHFKRLANLPLTKWSRGLVLQCGFTKHCGDWLCKQITLSKIELNRYKEDKKRHLN